MGNGFGTANACVTTPGATFSEPITLNIYSVGANNVPGSLLASDTQTFAIPYRPSASDPTGHSAAGCTASGGQWYDSTDGTCDNGLATNITFALSSQNVVLPNNVIYGIAYNTSDYGAVPYGDATACHADRFGLRLRLVERRPQPGPDQRERRVGPQPRHRLLEHRDGCQLLRQGAGGTGTFRIDGAADSSSCWDGGAATGWAVSGTGSPNYVPAVQINTTPRPSNTVVVTPPNLVTASPTTGQFLVTNESGGAGSVGIVSGPAGGPTADSLQMTTTGTNDHWDAFNYDRDGTLLSNISTLSYSAYTNNAPDFDPVFQLQANLGSGIPFATVSYEPYEQTTPDTANTWQSFNVSNGVVWATHIGVNAPGGLDDPTRWSSFVNLYPGATLLGVGADVGSAWPAMTGNVDALSIGTDGANGSTTTYDFNYPAPTTSIVLPSAGATLSGSTYLDATATNATSVQFLVFGGSFGFNAPVACTATGTVYGWACGWNTTSVPNGSYTLVAQATGPGGTTYSAGVSFKVSNAAPTTSIVLPSAWATLSGSTYLDAAATNGRVCSSWSSAAASASTLRWPARPLGRCTDGCVAGTPHRSPTAPTPWWRRPRDRVEAPTVPASTSRFVTDRGSFGRTIGLRYSGRKNVLRS